jgi:hypothetical protein
MTQVYGFYSDGKNAARRPVWLRVADETLDLLPAHPADTTAVQWPRKEVRLRDGEAQVRRSGVAILVFISCAPTYRD